MQVVHDAVALRTAVAAARSRGERVGFVPTMGALHEGHLSLLDRARAACECVVLSIFVNPLQFAPGEDLSRYPRTEAADLAAAAAHGTSLAFVPDATVMYPGPRVVSVVPQTIADRWEGAVRPGHFAGVLTVVAKLFNLVQPDLAIFGQKDLQQATLITALVRDLDFPLSLDIAPIVREPDGLAMSSRNRNLNADDRLAARCLSAALRAISDAFLRDGVRDASLLQETGTRILRAAGAASADYLEIVDSGQLQAVATAEIGCYAIVAVRIGSTRLLDNHRLGDIFPPRT